MTLGGILWVFALGPFRQFLGSLVFVVNFLGLNKSMDLLRLLRELTGGLSLQICECFLLTLVLDVMLDVGCHHVDKLPLRSKRRRGAGNVDGDVKFSGCLSSLFNRLHFFIIREMQPAIYTTFFR